VTDCSGNSNPVSEGQGRTTVPVDLVSYVNQLA